MNKRKIKSIIRDAKLSSKEVIQKEQPKTELTPEQKKDKIMILIGIPITIVVVILLYKWLLTPLLGDLIGLSKGWLIGISIILVFIGWGIWINSVNVSGFYERANRQLAQQGTQTKKEENPTDKIKELKVLLDSGAITKEEFEKKKGELLKKI